MKKYSTDNKKWNYLKIDIDFMRSLEVAKMLDTPFHYAFFFLYVRLVIECMNSDCVITYQGLEGSLAKELSLILKEDEKLIQALLMFLEANGMSEVLNENELFLVKAVKMIGSETDVAARMRTIREKRKRELPIEAPTNKPQITSVKTVKKTPLTNAERVRLHRQKKQICNEDVTNVTQICNEKNVTCNEDVTNVTQICNEKNVTCNEDVTNVTLHSTNETPKYRDYEDDRTMCGNVRKCAIEKEKEKEYKRGGNTHVYERAHEGDFENSPENIITTLARLLFVDEALIEDYLKLRLSSGNVKSPIGLETTILTQLQQKESVEQKRFEEWLDLQSQPPQLFNELVGELCAFGYQDRKKCLEISNEFSIRTNFTISPIAFELAFNLASDEVSA